MKISLRQKINIFISAAVVGTAGSMLTSGYSTDTAMFYWTLGGLLIAAGLATMLMDVMGRQVTTGSSDVILGAEKIAVGVWVLVQQQTAMENVHWLLAAVALYHALYLVQQAVEVRRLQRSRMAIFLTTAVLSFVSALGIAFLPVQAQKYLDVGLFMILDCAALLISGVSLLLVKAPKDAQASSAKAVTKPDAQTGAGAAAQPAAQAAAAVSAAPAAAAAAEPEEDEDDEPVPTAAQLAEDKENTAAANDAIKSFGRLAGKFKDRAAKTATAAVSGFKDGLHDTSGKQ